MPPDTRLQFSASSQPCLAAELPALKLRNIFGMPSR